MRYLPVLIGFFCLFLCSSCGTGNVVRPGEKPEGRVVLTGVPFYRQEDFQCGPAALAAAINYWHGRQGSTTRVTPEAIAGEIYSPTAKGVLGIDLEMYATRHGFTARQYSGSLEEIRRLIDRGIPPVILLDLGISLFQMNHFIVVTGYTPDGLLANTGRRENQFIDERRLESAWKKTGHWTLVIEPAG